MDLIIRRKNSSIQFQFLALFILLDIFCTCSCDKFQRKLITTNQGSDISADWKPLSIRDLKPPSAGISLHQGFISLSNSLNRNKLQQFGQLPHSHNSHILRSYQTHPQWNQNHHHHHQQFAHISPIGSHLPIQIPRFNQLTIPSNLPNLPVPVVPHTLGNGGTSTNGGILMKSPSLPAAAVSKSLIKSEPYGGPMGVVKAPAAPLFDVKQIHPPISKSITYNGLYTTTAKIPTPHHIRSPQLFKTFNNYALSDAVVLGGFSTSPSIYGPTSPRAPILGHQNFLGHTVIPTFKKYPVTNPPTGLGTYHHRHHLVPSSFISYSYPLTGKITNHFQTLQAPAAITTVRTHQTTSPPDNLISKHHYHVKLQQENSNILKVEQQSNSFQGPSSSEPPFVPAHQNHQNQQQHQNQNQPINRNKSKNEKGSATENDDENIEIISNSSPQVLPPVPASVLTPFFVPIDSQDFLNANSNKNHSDQSKNELFTEIDSLLSEDDYQSNDDSSVYTKNNAINFKDTSVTTTIKAVENYENFNKKDASSYISDVSSPSPSPAPPKFNEISGGNFNSISSTIRPLSVNNYRDQSNFVRPPNFKLEKFNSVFSTPRSTSHSFFPTPQNSFNSFFTLEDAVTINPFREFSSFDEINKIPEIPVKEKPINLDPPTPTNHQIEVKINHNRVNQPIRHRSRNRTESTPPTPSSTFQTYSRDTASYKERLNQTEKKPNNFAANRNPNRIESSSEKSEPTVQNENRVNKLRMKSNYKNSKRYQIRRNNTMDGVRFSSTIPSFRQSITNSQLPTSSSTAMTSPAVASSATSERATPISRINKIQYTRIPPSLKPIPPSPSQIPYQVASAEEIPVETTQTSTVTSTISFGIPTTTLDLQETPTPTFHIRPTEQQINYHRPTISSTEFQSQSSSASPIVETTKKRQRIKYRNQENEANKSTSKESLPEDTKSSSSPSIQSTSESIKKINPSERPKFSIRNYRRPLKNATISSSTTPPTTTTPAVTITRSTTSSTESSVEISSSASTDHDRANSSYTIRKRLFPSMKFRTNSSNNNTPSSSLENNRHKGRPNLRDSSSENLNSNTESKTTRDRGHKNHRDSNNNEMRPTRRRIPENRRVPYSNRNGNRGESSTSSKENDVYSNTPPSSPTPSSSTLEVPTIKNLSTSLSRRPPRISLKDRIQNHLNRKSSNDTQSNQMFDDLLNITLETRTNSVESTTSTSTPKIESAIMKIAKDDSHSHQRSTSTSTMNINNRSRSSSSSTPLTSTSTVSPAHTKSSVSFSTSSSTSSISSTSSSSSSSSSSSPSFPGGLDTDQNLVDDMSNISRYVDELTASSSTNSLNILNRGLHTRRIPNYFTLATEDPILPIEAFFPNVLKENNKINES